MSETILKGLCLEGNNGGDFLTIKPLDDGRVHLRVGHCCVTEISHVVPVEFITSLLVEAVLVHNGVKEAMESVGWPPDFITSLVAQIEEK